MNTRNQEILAQYTIGPINFCALGIENLAHCHYIYMVINTRSRIAIERGSSICLFIDCTYLFLCTGAHKGLMPEYYNRQ